MDLRIAGYAAPTLPPIPELMTTTPLASDVAVSVEVETAATLRSLDDGGVALAAELGHDLAPHWGEFVALLAL